MNTKDRSLNVVYTLVAILILLLTLTLIVYFAENGGTLIGKVNWDEFASVGWVTLVTISG
jgi:hypothetical protein